MRNYDDVGYGDDGFVKILLNGKVIGRTTLSGLMKDAGYNYVGTM